MKERGGGNQTDRPRWAGDGLLEIWGAQSCWLIWSVCSFLGRRRSAPVQVQAQEQEQPHHRHPHPRPRTCTFFPTGQFFYERAGDKQPADTQSPSCTGTRHHRGGQQAGPGREAKRGRWKLTFALPLPSSSSTQQAASSQPSALPSYPSLRAALPMPAWALTEVIHSLAYLAA